MQRAYDQVIHDVCLQKLHVVFCLDRAGVAGADGPTHHGAYDIAYMRCLPNMIVSAPMNEGRAAQPDVHRAVKDNGPFTIRYPRGNGVMADWKKPFTEIEIGKARLLGDGTDVAILTIGHVGNYATEVCEQLQADGISAAHVDMRFAKPLDEYMLHDIFSRFNRIVTVEDGCVMGGMGSAVLEFMANHNYQARVVRLGMPDKVIEHGEQIQLHEECGYDPKGIYHATRRTGSGKNPVLSNIALRFLSRSLSHWGYHHLNRSSICHFPCRRMVFSITSLTAPFPPPKAET